MFWFASGSWLAALGIRAGALRGFVCHVPDSATWFRF
jgi:hypothetical protein